MIPTFAILGLPVNSSGEHAQQVDTLLVGVHALMFALFIGWFIYFVYVLIRFNKKRNPKADYKGFTGHFSTYIEAIVAIIEAGLLFGLALPIWVKAVGKFPDAKDATVVKFIGRQFQWTTWYPNSSGTFVKADARFVSGDNSFGFDKNDPNFDSNFTFANEMVVPVGKPVIAYISSQDVIHSFSCRPLRTMQDAIPGMVIPAHFTPVKTGAYAINCAQLCGSGHYSMRGTVRVVTPEEYKVWYASKGKTVKMASASH